MPRQIELAVKRGTFKPMVSTYLTTGLITIRCEQRYGPDVSYREIGPGLPFVITESVTYPDEATGTFQIGGRVVCATRMIATFLPGFLVRNFSPENLGSISVKGN